MMTNEEVNKCLRNILKWKKKLNELQDACSHDGAKKVAGANTGNWCPQDNSYWYDYDCHVCGKLWREYQ